MKVVLYARVSSEKQDTSLSISAQLKALHEYTRRNKYQVVREFVDEAETGRTADRPEFKKMISMARSTDKPFDAILVWKYSRFSRSRTDSIVYKTLLKKNGIKVISINEPSDNTPSGRLFENIIEDLDEFYSDNLGEEVTRGMRESVSRGFYISSKPSYGYRKIRVQDGGKERTKLEINPDEASIVILIFDSILSGKSLLDIVRELNSKGIPAPKGKAWNKTGLYAIITNEIYTGTMVWGMNSKRGLEPVKVEGAVPVIIDKDAFYNVQRMLKERSPVKIHPKRVSSRFLLSGLAKCGYCGKSLVGQDAKSGKFSYYVCGTLNKKGAGSCRSRYLNSNRFEGIVIDRIKEFILTKENLTQLTNLVNEEIDNASIEQQDELALIAREENNVSFRLGKLYDAIETGKVNLDDLAPRIRHLRNRQVRLQDRRVELERILSDRRVELADLDTVKEYVDNLRNVLDDSPLSEKRIFIRSFIKEVKVTGDEAVLTYVIPVLPEHISEKQIGVLSTVRYGGR